MATMNFRARVMKYAWQIWNATRQSWSLCMKKAWRLYRLIKDMKEGVVNFRYLKTNGTMREAVGTLFNLPTEGRKARRTKEPSFKTITYYDIAKGAFRSFRVENLISVEAAS